VYDFTRLDKLVQILWTNGLQPGFELMGNPANIFTDFQNKTQVFMWKDLIQTMAKNYIGKVHTWKIAFILMYPLTFRCCSYVFIASPSNTRKV
jgi:hypothetical protein